MSRTDLFGGDGQLSSEETEFLTFWAQYPRKVGKLAAAKAYRRARRGTTAAAILLGLEQ